MSRVTNWHLPLQGEELEPARRKAEAAGVKEIYIDDLREEFVRDYVFPMFRSVQGRGLFAVVDRTRWWSGAGQRQH